MRDLRRPQPVEDQRTLAPRALLVSKAPIASRALVALLAPLIGVAACAPAEQPAPEEEEEGARPCAVFWDCELGEVCSPEGVCVAGDDEVECVDQDEDGYGQGCGAGLDCDDRNFFRNPALDEVCNGADDNCDFLIDEGGVCEGCQDECTPGASECASDTSFRTCNVINGCARWAALEHCDGQDCVGGACVDACDDFDGDGFGVGCAQGEDCNDRNPFSFPGGREVCDGYDNDCDGVVDQGGICDEPCASACADGERRCQGGGFQVCVADPRGCLDWSMTLPCQGETSCSQGVCVDPVVCLDRDGDGFGVGCAPGPDCDDVDSALSPRALEVCDAVDNDCDGLVDDGLSGCQASWCQAERHDTLATARRLLSGESGAGYACPGQGGLWDLGALGAGQGVMIVGQWASGVDRLEVELVRADLQVVASGSGAGVAFRATAGQAGRHLLRVRGAVGGAYAIGWSPSELPCGQDDHESNNSPASASPSLYPGRVISGGICGGDLDFFAVPSARAGQVLTAELIGGASAGRLLLEVWHDGRAITPDQSRSGGAVHAHSRLDMPGQYAVAVRGINPGVVSGYLLAVSVLDRACADDNGEQDDRIDRGRPLNGQFLTGTLCPGDLDYLLLGQRAEGSSVDLSLEFDAGAANLDAYLFRETLDGFLQVALTDGAPERLPTRIPRSGVYHVLVIGRGPGDGAPYTFRR